MKQIIVVTVLSLGGILAWQLSYRLSSDALAMAIGIVFGLLAGVPTLLLVLVGNEQQRRRNLRPYDVEDYKAQFCDRNIPPTYVTYNDNRQLTIQAVVNPQWPTMPLLADRQREIQRGTAIVRR